MSMPRPHEMNGVFGTHKNLRRGYYELAVEEPAGRRLAVAFDGLAMAI